MTFLIQNSDNHIETVYSDAYFFEGGAGYPNYHHEAKILIERGKYYSKILESHGAKKGKLLEVGCAAGYLLQGLKENGWTVTGIEPNKTMSDFGSKHLGLEIFNTSAENWKSEKTFNVLCLIQVIAHLRDPASMVEKLIAHLTTPGWVLVETWNYQSLTAKIMGRGWHEYTPPGVLHWFCPDSLDSLFSRYGLNLVHRGSLPKKILWEHARSLLETKMEGSVWQKLFSRPLRLIPDGLSLRYLSEDLFYAIYSH